MEPKVGDRVSLDSKKVGQPRRGGVVRNKSEGISGTRYEVEWDDGSRSMIFPSAGVLLVEGRAPKGKGSGNGRSKSKSSTSKNKKKKATRAKR